MKYFFKKSIVISSVVFLVMSLVVFAFIYKGIEGSNIQREQKQLEWQKEASRRQEVKTLDQSVKTIEPERILLETHFAGSSDVVPFLNSIEDLGNKSGAKTKVSSVEISADGTFLIVDTKTTGTFEQIYRFIKLLENSSYEIDLDSVDIHNLASDEELDTRTKGSRWEAIIKIKLVSFIS